MGIIAWVKLRIPRSATLGAPCTGPPDLCFVTGPWSTCLEAPFTTHRFQVLVPVFRYPLFGFETVWLIGWPWPIPTEYRWLFCGIPDWLKPEPKPVGITRRPPRSTKSWPKSIPRSTKIDLRTGENRPPVRPKSPPGPTQKSTKSVRKKCQKRRKKSTKKSTS